VPGFIPKFKATAASRLEIRDFSINASRGTHWIMMPSELLQKQYLPEGLTAHELALADKQRWDSTRDYWMALSSKSEVLESKTDGLLSLFANTLAWYDKRPQTEAVEDTSDLKAAGSPSGLDTIPATATASRFDGRVPETRPPLQTGAFTATASSAPSSRQPWLIGDLPVKLIQKLDVMYLDLPRIAMVNV
jgi:hypothetical protein